MVRRTGQGRDRYFLMMISPCTAGSRSAMMLSLGIIYHTCKYTTNGHMSMSRIIELAKVPGTFKLVNESRSKGFGLQFGWRTEIQVAYSWQRAMVARWLGGTVVIQS